MNEINVKQRPLAHSIDIAKKLLVEDGLTVAPYLNILAKGSWKKCMSYRTISYRSLTKFNNNIISEGF